MSIVPMNTYYFCLICTMFKASLHSLMLKCRFENGSSTLPPKARFHTQKKWIDFELTLLLHTQILQPVVSTIFTLVQLAK